MSATRIRIALNNGGSWDITVRQEALKAVNGLPSGMIVKLQRATGDVQVQDIWVRPYYRRIITGELNIFAVQVMPNKEAHRG